MPYELARIIPYVYPGDASTPTTAESAHYHQNDPEAGYRTASNDEEAVERSIEFLKTQPPGEYVLFCDGRVVEHFTTTASVEVETKGPGPTVVNTEGATS